MVAALLFPGFDVKRRDVVHDPAFEALHPRGYHGRFGDKPGGNSSSPPRARTARATGGRRSLTGPQRGALQNLHDQDGTASAGGVHAATLRSLEQRGLVETSGTGRQRQVTLTDAGRAELGVPAKPEPTEAELRAERRRAARRRGREVEQAVAAAGLLATVDELIAKGTPREVLLEHVHTMAGLESERADLTDLVKLVEGAKRPDTIRRRLDIAADRRGLHRLDEAGSVVPFVDGRHKPLGDDPGDGAPVRVIRPGYVYRSAGHDDVQVSESTVVQADAEQVLAGDFSGLRQIGEQAGGTEGGLFEAADGSQWYVKAQMSADHANNEAAASALYREAGIEVPEIIRGAGTPGLSGENHTATRMLPDAYVDLESIVRTENHEFLSQVYEGFAVDAWLANWDVAGENPAAGWDNIVATESYMDSGSGGRPVRIDVGGALLFRGLGGPKGAAFGPVVTEWDRLRDPTSDRASAKTFRKISPAEMLASAERVQRITPARIRKIVAEQGLPASVADTLIKRRADIISRAKSLKNDKHVKDAKTAWQDVTDASPARLSTLLQHMMDNGYTRDRAHKSSDALMEYQSDGYKPINGRLLRGEYDQASSDDDNEHDAYTRAIDRAMALSALTDDIIVYRGERNPSRNFPPGEWSLVGGMEGAEWTFAAFSSASADPQFAEYFAQEYNLYRPRSQSPTAQPTVFRIRTPKGTRAVAMNGSGANSDEVEVILDRDIRYRVVADHGVIAGIRRLDVEVVK